MIEGWVDFVDSRSVTVEELLQVLQTLQPQDRIASTVQGNLTVYREYMPAGQVYLMAQARKELGLIAAFADTTLDASSEAPVPSGSARAVSSEPVIGEPPVPGEAR